MPVLAIGAEAGYGEASAATMPRVARNVSAVVVERCGHYVPERQPAVLVRAIADFLTAAPEGSPG